MNIALIGEDDYKAFEISSFIITVKVVSSHVVK